MDEWPENKTKPEDGSDKSGIASGTSIRHLHMDPAATDQVETLGCLEISDIANVLTNPELSAANRHELATCSFRLLGCVSGDGVDWLSYYQHPDFEPKGLYFNCMEFRELHPGNPAFSVNRASLGNAGAMLERAGIGTFGLLVEKLRDGIRDLPSGFGKVKLLELWGHLTKLAQEIRKNPELLQVLAIRHPITGTTGREFESLEETDPEGNNEPPAILSSQIRALDLGVLHLGKKSDMLRKQGLITIGNVADYPRWKFLSLPSMGKTTVSRITAGLEALTKAQGPDGEVDWETYCDLMKLTLLPSQPLTGTFAQTIALLPLVIEETVLAGETDDNRIILENRIMKPPSERLTLEAVGELMPTRITRERVRQKEAMILRRLAASLVHGDYAKAPYHFRPEFTEPWRKAAEHFSSIEGDISLNDLITGLELAW